MAGLRGAPPRLRSAPPRLAAAPKRAAPFYQSSEWITLRAAIVAERGSRCEWPGCGHVGFVIADHVKELRDGGAALDPNNIMLLCAAHHGRKTQQAKQARMRGKKGEGAVKSPQP